MGFDDGNLQMVKRSIGKQIGMELWAISASRDHKWIVCGTCSAGASVWDANVREKVIDMEGRETMSAVDVSPDSASFATRTGSSDYDSEASVWSIMSGKRLIGPLKHDDSITGIRFSSNGEHIATASWGKTIRIFDSHSGDEVIVTTTVISPRAWPNIPLEWSNDGQQIFATSEDKKIWSFIVSTGSQIAKSPILDGGNHNSIALAPNGKFIAAFVYY